MKALLGFIGFSIILFTTASCNIESKILKGSRIYRPVKRTEGDEKAILSFYEVKKGVKISKLEESDGQIKFTFSKKESSFDSLVTVKNKLQLDTQKLELSNNELSQKRISEDKAIYFYYEPKDPLAREKINIGEKKFGIQALTIPLKFRRSVGNDTINPPTVETGVNLGFAFGLKLSKNVYSLKKNYTGKNNVVWSITPGVHLGLSAYDLDPKTNAPGLLSKRKAPVFVYGGYLLFGYNNINIGYAFGFDSVIGQGGKNWVYQNKLWHGVIIALDILKF